MSAVPFATHPSHRAPRAVRSALFAVICVGVGATLHGVAGGCAATWIGIGIGLAAVGPAAWFGLARERSWPALTIGLGLAQVGLHLLLTGLESGAAAAHATASAALNAAAFNPGALNSGAFNPGAFNSTALSAGAPAMPTDMSSMPGMVIQHPNPYSAALTMITAHALAVVVCGWWLGQGERDFFALCRAVGALVAAPVHRLTDAVAALVAVSRAAVYVVPRPCRTAQHDRLAQRPGPLLTALTFRGPPVVA